MMDSYDVTCLSNTPTDFTEMTKSCSRLWQTSFVSSDGRQNICESFFRTAYHPAFMLDLNVNAQKAQPPLFNLTASSLVSSCKDFFKESRLEKFNGTLGEFIYSAKRRVAEEIRHLDLMHVTVKSGTEATETTFSLNAWSFDFGRDNKVLGIVLTEISKTIKEELNALEIFKESLVSALSHELNNPMNSLIPLLKMMPSCYNGAKKEDIKEMALASAIILQNKIRDLIDYAKIKQEKIKLNLVEFYVEDLFDKIKRIFKYEAEEKSNHFVTQINAQYNKKLLVLGDRDRIEQVLVKLISNANKYTEGGAISLAAEENPKNFNVIFSVQDTGIGMSKKTVETIFAPLPQKARNLETAVRLPGLGLEIAKALCQYMECKLNVVSVEGEGSRFFFEVPVCRIAVFEEVMPSMLFDSVKAHEAPPMLLNHNKGTKRALFSKDVIASLEKAKLASEGKRMSRRLTYNGAILKLASSFRTPHNHSAHPIRRKKFPRFSQKHLIVAQQGRYSTISPSTGADVEWDVSEEPPVSIKVMPQYDRPMRVHMLAGEEEKEAGKVPSVMVVDDNYSNRFVVREMVKAMKIDTIEGKNGQDAVNIVESSFKPEYAKEIAIIFMDLSMPIMNGIDATVEIRKLEKKYNRSIEIPIVAITGQGAMNDKSKCFEVGMQEYVKKPISNRMVKKIIAQYAPDLLSNA